MRFLIATLIILFHTTSFAKWQFLGTVVNEKGDSDQYYDDALIKKGNFPKIWILKNYKNGFRDEDGDVYFSEKTLYEFSCKEREYRLVNMTQYSDNLGKGKVTYTTSEKYLPKWRAIVPDSIVSVWHGIICN